METLAKLRNDMQKLKTEESFTGGVDDVTTDAMQANASRWLVQVPCSDSTAVISDFTSNSAVHCPSSNDSDSGGEGAW